jgi:hypothetical protein
MRAKLPLLILLPWLTGCAAAGTCSLIALKAYSPAFEALVLAEIEAGQAPALAQFAADHVALRDQVRACQGE